MSRIDPPRYDDGDLESLPLLTTLKRCPLDIESQLGSHSAVSPGERGEDRELTMYTFIPRYPLKGERQDMIGFSGLNREETIAIVQKGFSVLIEYPAQRVEFLAPMLLAADGSAIDDCWAVIMDDAWPTFSKSHPARLRVQIQDGPGDEEARKAQPSREAIRIMTIALAGFIGGGVLYICIVRAVIG